MAKKSVKGTKMPKSHAHMTPKEHAKAMKKMKRRR